MRPGAAAAPFPPPGYRRWRRGPHDIVAHEAVVDAIDVALAGSPALHAWARATGDPLARHGRGHIHAVRLDGERAVVRHYRRGGWMAPLLGDLYFDRPPRPFAELQVSEALRAADVSTPRVLAGIASRAGLGYRADLASRWIEPGHDLVALLAPNQYSPDARAGALAAAGELVGRAHRAGLEHPDLNAGNLFVQPTGTGWRAWLLDLDRARMVHRPPTARALARFRRSLEKLRRLGRIDWSPADLDAFDAGYREAGGPPASRA